MPPPDPAFGPQAGGDTLTISCCIAQGYDDPAFIEWRQDHPDWFAAGTWTRASDRESGNRVQSTARDAIPGADPERPQPSPPPPDRRDPVLAATRATVGRGKPFQPLDPATLSVADFRKVAAEAKAAPRPLTPAPDPPTPDAPG